MISTAWQCMCPDYFGATMFETQLPDAHNLCSRVVWGTFTIMQNHRMLQSSPLGIPETHVTHVKLL